MNNKEFITPYGLFSTIVVTVIGVGVFSFPREATAQAGTDSWIITLVSGAVSYLLIYFAVKAVKRHNYQKLYDILSLNFGKLIGSIMALIFIAYNIFAISIGLRVFIEVIKMYLLERTPTEFLIMVTILTGIYILRGEVVNLVKFNEISFWIMFIPIIVIFLLTLNRTDFTNIFPILSNTPKEYANALTTTIYTFGGFEIIYLMLPYMADKSSILKAVRKSIAFITIFYTFVVIFCLAVFAKEQTKILLWPTITLIKSINIPGAFVERWEGVVMALWVMFYFTTFINSYYLSADILKDMFKLYDIKLSSALLIPFIYGIAMYPENIAEVYDMSKNIMPYLTVFSFFVLPALIYIKKPSRKKIEEGGC